MSWGWGGVDLPLPISNGLREAVIYLLVLCLVQVVLFSKLGASADDEDLWVGEFHIGIVVDIPVHFSFSIVIEAGQVGMA
jgi:hypothetical protein